MSRKPAEALRKRTDSGARSTRLQRPGYAATRLTVAGLRFSWKTCRASHKVSESLAARKTERLKSHSLEGPAPSTCSGVFVGETTARRTGQNPERRTQKPECGHVRTQSLPKPRARSPTKPPVSGEESPERLPFTLQGAEMQPELCGDAVMGTARRGAAPQPVAPTPGSAATAAEHPPLCEEHTASPSQVPRLLSVPLKPITTSPAPRLRLHTAS